MCKPRRRGGAGLDCVAAFGGRVRLSHGGLGKAPHLGVAEAATELNRAGDTLQSRAGFGRAESGSSWRERDREMRQRGRSWARSPGAPEAVRGCGEHGAASPGLWQLRRSGYGDATLSSSTTTTLASEATCIPGAEFPGSSKEGLFSMGESDVTWQSLS